MDESRAVDIHGHFIIPELLKAEGRTEAWRYELSHDSTGRVSVRRGNDTVPCHYEPMDLQRIVENMDMLRVGVMAINIAPFQMAYDLDAKTGANVARVANESLIDASARFPDRFIAMGTLPMQDTDASTAELSRIMSDGQMAGVELGSNVNGVYLGAERFRPVWEAISDLGAAVFVHPVNVLGADRLGEYFLANLIGNPVESARCIADVVFSGLLEAFPDLRICFAHGGGAAPILLGRWDHGFIKRPAAGQRISRPPSEYLRMLYFDHITHSELALRYLIDLVGADHVMIGTDYPFDMGPDEPVAWVQGSIALSPSEKAAVMSGTARKFLRLKP